VVIQASRGGLTSIEQSLVEHVRQGEWLDLGGDEVIDEAEMRSWGPSRTCRSTVIRDILRGQLTANPDPHGLRLRGAKITGRLDLQNLRTEVNFELEDCFLAEGILAQDAYLATVDLSGCLMEHPTEPPLDATRLTCRQLSLRNASVISHSEGGGARLVDAHIGRNLDCRGASLCNDSGPALDVEGAQISRSMSLRGLAATCSDEVSAVNLSAAHIGVELDCEGASLRNKSGMALLADGLEVGKCVFLRGGFTATGVGELGAVRLRGVHIGISLECDGAKLDNDSGPALSAQGLWVGQNVLLREGFTATGAGTLGAVFLRSAHIGARFDCAQAKLHNCSGPALNAYGMQVDQDMFFTAGFTAIGGGPGVAVDLTAARVGGALVFAPQELMHMADSHQRLALDGLTYAGVPREISAQDWLRLLRDATPGYAAQPYQQLATGYRALGDERRAREILMAQRDDQLSRTETRRPEWTWSRITKITLGYGYQPWRALLFLAAVLALSCVLAVTLGSHGALTQTLKTATPDQPCTLVQRVSVGLDLNLPVGTTVARTTCDLTRDSASTTAAWLTVAGWVLRVMAWVFAALFIAGFTSAVRKT